MKILITSCGSTNGINVIKALQKEIDWQKEWKLNEIKLELIGVDADKLASGFHFVKRGYVVPKASNRKFIPELLRICIKEKVRILFPILSYEIPVIIRNRKKFDKLGVKMAVSDYKTYKLTENKIETNKFFDRIGIPYPKETNKFPLIIKPIKDTSGSKNVHKVENDIELKFYKYKCPDSFTQEFVKGQEYTIDGLCDLNGEMVYALPRKRLEVRDGMAVKSITEYNEKLIEYTRKIVEGLGLVGAFNIQCIKNSKIYFIEVNNRFGSGGLPLMVGANLNIPMDIIRMLLNKKIPEFRYKRFWIYDKIKMSRYQDAIIWK